MKFIKLLIINLLLLSSFAVIFSLLPSSLKFTFLILHFTIFYLIHVRMIFGSPGIYYIKDDKDTKENNKDD